MGIKDAEGIWRKEHKLWVRQNPGLLLINSRPLVGLLTLFKINDYEIQ